MNPGYQPHRLAYEQDRDISLRAMKYVVHNEIDDENELTAAIADLTKAEKQWFRRHREQLYLTREDVLMKRIKNVHIECIPEQSRTPKLCHLPNIYSRSSAYVMENKEVTWESRKPNSVYFEDSIGVDLRKILMSKSHNVRNAS